MPEVNDDNHFEIVEKIWLKLTPTPVLFLSTSSSPELEDEHSHNSKKIEFRQLINYKENDGLEAKFVE